MEEATVGIFDELDAWNAFRRDLPELQARIADGDYRDWVSDWQPGLEAMLEFCIMAQSGTLGESPTWTEIVETYGPGGYLAIDWDALGIAHMFAAYEAEMGHADAIRRRATIEISEVLLRILQPYFDAWEFSRTVEDPTAQAVTVADIDWAIVRSWNEALLKDLPEGESLKYWQVPEGLIIGDQQSLAWRQAAERQNGAEPTGENHTGWIEMVEKGGRLSPGALLVNGACDQVALKASLREFTRKKVDFE